MILLGGKMESSVKKKESMRTKIARWLDTAYQFVQDREWPRGFAFEDVNKQGMSLALAYHAGVRDTLVRILREGDLEELQEIRENLAELDRFKRLLK